MKCYFCDCHATGVTRITDPILLAGLVKKLHQDARILSQTEYLVCPDHLAQLTGRSTKGNTNAKK